MAQSIQFCGAAETVTGSKHLLTLSGKQVLVDCGIFQGSSELTQRNRQPFPFDPNTLDAVVITHAHMDHIGMLPRLVRDGYRGVIYATPATIALAKISLPDSGRIQEEDARHANKYGFSQHKPALPLYTEADAFACLKQFKPVKYYTLTPLPGGAQWQFVPAGHILGSAYAEIYFENGERILMGGDLGRYNTPIIKDPATIDFAEYLVVESTYGDRLHSQEDVLGHLEKIVNEAFKNAETILVPSFAIGRTQDMLYYMHQLQDQNRIPRIPLYVDSPMATSTTELYKTSSDEFDEEMQHDVDLKLRPLDPENLKLIRDREESKALNSAHGPMMIIAGSGMANGGRIVHHLLHRLSNPRTLVLFTGYQAEGTLGRRLLEGASMVKIQGHEVEVQARIDKLNALSAHADQGEILQWLKGFKQEPKRTFIVHGEPPAQAALKAKMESDLGWSRIEIPHPLQRFDL